MHPLYVTLVLVNKTWTGMHVMVSTQFKPNSPSYFRIHTVAFLSNNEQFQNRVQDECDVHISYRKVFACLRYVGSQSLPQKLRPPEGK